MKVLDYEVSRSDNVVDSHIFYKTTVKENENYWMSDSVHMAIKMLKG